MHVLLVEDDVGHIVLIRRAFDDAEISLSLASNLKEAHEKLSSEVVDLIISDLLLPDGQGIELIERANQISCPIMIMTSHGDQERAVEAMKAGVVDYVVKTEITLMEMPRTAERAMRQWQNQQARQQAESALRESEDRFRRAIEYAPYPVMIHADDGSVVSINKTWLDLTGYSRDELSSYEDWLMVAHKDETSRGLLLDGKETLYRIQERTIGDEMLITTKAGEQRVWQFSAAPLGNMPDGRKLIITMATDMTEAERLSSELTYQASHDSLTDLVNRREFERRLRHLLEIARQNTAVQHALCYLDLDQFKIINDTCGHLAGDELLRQLGNLLQRRVRKSDTLARLGGDEFGVLMESCSLEQAHRVADLLRKAIEEFRFLWEDKVFNLGVSIGLVPIGQTSGTVSDVMSLADSACYVAKESGRNRIYTYQENDAEMIRRHGEMQWALKIPQAIEKGSFSLYMQPIVPVDERPETGRHFELLVRMETGDGGFVKPDVFLSAAERYNLSTRLDTWIVEQSIIWVKENLSDIALCGINLSGLSLGEQSFLDFVTECMQRHDVPPSKICFEITETAAIENMSKASQFIKTLKGLGCQFALDDFGSGLSSFAYLRNLPVDFLKIDGIFIKDLVDNQIGQAMVRSINEIGHIMGKKTVAEFVESRGILEQLQELGVDYAQGYYVGPPRPIRL
ncbi:MAG: EAL domain-containing protein [Pseudomonadota bacterium]